MINFKKSVSIAAATCMMVTSMSPAFAKVTDYVTQKDGKTYEYNVEELRKSIIDGTDLFKTFSAEDKVALLDDVQGYINYQDVVGAIIGTEDPEFDVNEYTESEVAEKSTVKPDFEVVVGDDGKLIVKPVKLTIETVTVINATQVSVKFVGMVEVQTIDLTTALVEGDNDITFTFDEKEYTATVNYVLPDTEAPVLVYGGESTVSVINGATFTAPVVTATDNKDTAVEVTKIITDSKGAVITAIDTTVAGTYTITYSAKDEAGNVAENKVVTVTVEEAALKVEAVSAINAKNLTVTFNSAVADTTKAVFEVKKGITTVGVASTTWNAAKTVATLELNTKVTEGTYSVSVTGLGDAALTGEVKTENEKVAEIKLLSDSLVVTTAATAIATGEATTGYQLVNQYGEDVTSNSAFRSKVTFTSSHGSATADKDGKVTVVTNIGTKVDDKIALTAIDSANAITANKILTVVDSAKVSEITFGEVYNRDGKSLNEDTRVGNDFYLLVTLKDQYGNEITDKAKASTTDLTVLSSDELVMGKPTIAEVTINEKKQLALKLDPRKSGDSLITAIATANGKSASKKITVGEGTKVDTVLLGTPEGTPTGSNKVLIPVEITNNKGEAVTKVADVKNTTFTATQGSSAISAGNIKLVEKEGALYLEVTTNSVASKQVENLLVTAQTPTNNFASKSYQVKADAVATALVGVDSKVSTAILKGETLNVKEKDFVVEDQYGNRITDVAKYSVQGVSKDGYIVTAAADGVNVRAIDSNETKDTTKLAFTLYTEAGVKVSPESTIDINFSLVKSSDFSSYKVETLGSISNATTTKAGAYAKKLKVYGVTASGQEVLLPTSEYSVVGDSTLDYAADTNTVFVKSGQVDVAGNTSNLPETKAGELTVTTNSGEVIKVAATATAVAPKAAKVGLYVGGDVKKDSIIAIEETTGTLNAATINTVATGAIYIEDQYGVDITGAAKSRATYTFTNLKDANKKDATTTNNGLNTATITNFNNGDTVTVKIAVDGVSTTVNATGKHVDTSDVAATKAILTSEDVTVTDYVNVAATSATKVSGTLTTTDYSLAQPAAATSKAIATFDFSAGSTKTFKVNGADVVLDADYADEAGIRGALKTKIEALGSLGVAGTYKVENVSTNQIKITTVATGVAAEIALTGDDTIFATATTNGTAIDKSKTFTIGGKDVVLNADYGTVVGVQEALISKIEALEGGNKYKAVKTGADKVTVTTVADGTTATIVTAGDISVFTSETKLGANEVVNKVTFTVNDGTDSATVTLDQDYTSVALAQDAIILQLKDLALDVTKSGDAIELKSKATGAIATIIVTGDANEVIFTDGAANRIANGTDAQ